jgi:serine/threonine-protein kinase
VALKIPHPHLVTEEVLSDFRQEVRVMAKLDHANILPLKDASFIDSHFVIVFPLGKRTLADRLRSRLSLRTALDYAGQILDAVAHAHENRIIHCDIKPENFILFDEDQVRLTDFGIAKVAHRTIQGSGWGTLGYIAPEQAMGKPSFRSDVFSLGLVLYRMLSGKLPDWPYEWPPPGFDRMRKRVHPELVEVVRKAMEFNSRKRYCDARQMRNIFQRVKPRALRYTPSEKPRSAGGTAKQDWQAIRRRSFQREHGGALETRHACHRCGGPVSEAMRFCPWCGRKRSVHRGESSFPAQCPRCKRGLKLDWSYCPWCFGPGFEVATARRYSDKRYQSRCSNAACSEKLLMPFMRYCPWCHRKVRRPWKVPGSKHACSSCGWGVFETFWSYCAWCGKKLSAT